MRLWSARFGLVSQPQPRGALKPSEWRTNRFTDVRAAMRFLSDGMRKPNFIHEMSRIHAHSQSTLSVRIGRAISVNSFHAGSVDNDPAKWMVTQGMREREISKVKQAEAEHLGKKEAKADAWVWCQRVNTATPPFHKPSPPAQRRPASISIQIDHA
jgi:hypothetical protein